MNSPPATNRRTLKWRRMATFLEDEEAAKARMEERVREQQKGLDVEFTNIKQTEAIIEQQTSAAFIERIDKYKFELNELETSRKFLSDRLHKLRLAREEHLDEGADNQKMNYLKRTARIDPDVSVKDIASLKQAELDEMQIKIGLEQRNTHLLKRMVTILRDDIKGWKKKTEHHNVIRESFAKQYEDVVASLHRARFEKHDLDAQMLRYRAAIQLDSLNEEASLDSLVEVRNLESRSLVDQKRFTSLRLIKLEDERVKNDKLKSKMYELEEQAYDLRGKSKNLYKMWEILQVFDEIERLFLRTKPTGRQRQIKFEKLSMPDTIVQRASTPSSHNESGTLSRRQSRLVQPASPGAPRKSMFGGSPTLKTPPQPPRDGIIAQIEEFFSEFPGGLDALLNAMVKTFQDLVSSNSSLDLYYHEISIQKANMTREFDKMVEVLKNVKETDDQRLGVDEVELDKRLATTLEEMNSKQESNVVEMSIADLRAVEVIIHRLYMFTLENVARYCGTTWAFMIRAGERVPPDEFVLDASQKLAMLVIDLKTAVIRKDCRDRGARDDYCGVFPVNLSKPPDLTQVFNALFLKDRPPILKEKYSTKLRMMFMSVFPEHPDKAMRWAEMIMDDCFISSFRTVNELELHLHKVKLTHTNNIPYALTEVMEMNVNKFKLEVLQDLIDLLGSLMAQYSGHMKIIMQAQQKLYMVLTAINPYIEPSSPLLMRAHAMSQEVHQIMDDRLSYLIKIRRSDPIDAEIATDAADAVKEVKPMTQIQQENETKNLVETIRFQSRHGKSRHEHLPTEPNPDEEERLATVEGEGIDYFGKVAKEGWSELAAKEKAIQAEAEEKRRWNQSKKKRLSISDGMTTAPGSIGGSLLTGMQPVGSTTSREKPMNLVLREKKAAFYETDPAYSEFFRNKDVLHTLTSMHKRQLTTDITHYFDTNSFRSSFRASLMPQTARESQHHLLDKEQGSSTWRARTLKLPQAHRRQTDALPTPNSVPTKGALKSPGAFASLPRAITTMHLPQPRFSVQSFKEFEQSHKEMEAQPAKAKAVKVLKSEAKPGTQATTRKQPKAQRTASQATARKPENSSRKRGRDSEIGSTIERTSQTARSNQFNFDGILISDPSPWGRQGNTAGFLSGVILATFTPVKTQFEPMTERHRQRVPLLVSRFGEM